MSLELLALGADFVGGLMGHSAKKKAMRQAQAQFDQQMDHSVRRRVEDAKRAGVHPLFALGASVGASPTTVSGGEGSPMGDALARMADTLGVIEKNKASAAKDEAEAMLADSERKRIEQEMNERRTGQSETTGAQTFPYGQKKDDVLGEWVEVPPEIQKSRPGNPGVVAGPGAPGVREFTVPGGYKMRVFDEGMQMDELNQVVAVAQMPFWGLHRAMKHFGWEKDENGVWRKVRKRDPAIRIKDKDGNVVWSW